MIPLQISWFVDYVPTWLSPMLMATGLGIAIAEVFIFSEGPSPDLSHVLSGVHGAIGGAVLFYGVFLNYSVLFVGITLCLAEYIKGLAAVHFYQRLSFALRKRRYPHKLTISIVTELKTYLYAGFLIVLLFWAAIFIAIWGPVDIISERSIRLFWTLFTVIVSVVGLVARFWPVKSEVPTGLLIGVVLIIVGSQIYNLQAIKLDMFLFVISGVAYSVGFWGAGYSILRT